MMNEDKDPIDGAPSKVVSTTAESPPEEAPPRSSSSPSATKSTAPKSKWFKVGIAASAVVAVGLGVGLGVGLSQRNKNAAAAASSSASSQGGLGIEETTTTTTTTTIAPSSSSSSSSSSTTASPASISTTTTTPTTVSHDADATTTPTTTASTTTTAATSSSTTTSSTTTSRGEGADVTTTTEKPEEGVGTVAESDLAKSHIYSSADAASDDGSGEGGGGGTATNVNQELPWMFRSFSAEVLSGYEACDDLWEDLRDAAHFLAGRIIIHDAQQDDRYYTVGQPMPEDGAPSAANDDADATAESGDASSAAKESDSAGGGEDSYDTNVQHQGVDEPDVVKSDGVHVWIAMGNKIVMTDAVSGVIVSETVMPQPEYNESMYDCPHYPHPMPEVVDDVGDEENGDDEGSEPVASEPMPPPEATGGGSSASAAGVSTNTKPGNRKASIAIMPPCYSPPTAHVRGLLLDKDNHRLIAFVEGYEPYWYHWSTPDEDKPILSDWGTTEIKVYDTTSFEEVEVEVDNETYTRTSMVQVSNTGANGRFVDARMFESDSAVHAVTMNDVDTYTHIAKHVQRWNPRYKGMTSEEYEANATEFAKEVSESFANRLLAELQEHHGDDDMEEVCANIAKLAVYQTGLDEESLTAHNWWYNRGILGGLVEVSSFQVKQDPPGGGAALPPVEASTSSAFVPSSWGTTVYASDTMLFLANVGYQGHGTFGWIPSTFIFAYNLHQGPGAQAAVRKGRRRRGRRRRAAEGGGNGPRAKPVGVGNVPGRVLNQYSMDMDGVYLRIATTTPGEWGCIAEDGTLVEQPWMEGAPDCEWGQWRTPHNQVTVLATTPVEEDGEDDEGVLPWVTSTGTDPEDSLGEPGESIFAVRFMGDYGFVVTFRQTDPFYILDLSNPQPNTPINVIGELKIPGFSNYLHPVGEHLLLAVGQNADDDGRQTGLQLSLFEFQNKTNPQRVAVKNVQEDYDDGDEDEDEWSHSYSDAQHDFKAFRWLSGMKKVIIPSRVYGSKLSEPFDGFNIYDVGLDTDNYYIEKDFDVNMLENWDEYWCWGPSTVPPRSLVFQGNATFIKGHIAKSVRIETEKFRWETNLDGTIPIPKGGCYVYWGWGWRG